MTTALLFMDALPTTRLLANFPVSPKILPAFGWSAILTPVCQKHGINTKVRLAMFLANVLHETGDFSKLIESMDYRADRLLAVFGRHRITEEQARRFGRQPGEGPLSEARQRAIANILYGGEWGRRNLGNTLPDDGWRFRGSGLMQLTGRSNYERFARKIGTTADDAFVAKLRTPQGAAESAAHFWQISGCGLRADDEDVEGVRRIINGGTIGLDDVRKKYERLMALIDADAFTPEGDTILRLTQI